MKELITICVVNYNSSDFILNILYCLEKITKNPYKVIIRDNNSKIKDYRNLERGIKKYENVSLYRVNNFDLIGSAAHGTALNDLIERIDSEFGVILDADCTFLYKNWDQVLIDKLTDKIPIIGTQPPYSKDFQKPMDFPVTYALLFKTQTLHSLKIDFLPSLHLKNQEEGFKDTGSLLRENYLKNGFQGIVLKYRSTRNYKEGPFRNLTGIAEYYLDGFEDIFVSHFGRGSSLGKAKYLKGWKSLIYQFPIFGQYLLKQKGIREKKNGLRYVKLL